MPDSPSFRDVAIEATKEPEAPTASAPEGQPSATANPPEQPKPEETFADKGDLTGKTPEQLEEIYKNWQRSYTEKRQKETQRLKDLEAKLSELEKRPAQAPVATPETIAEKKDAAQEALNLGQMTVSQYTDYMRRLAVEEAKVAAREEYKVIAAEEREDRLAKSALEKFQSADSRLNEHSPDFDETFKLEVQRELADMLDKHLEETGSYEGFDSDSLTKQIVERKDKQLDEIIKKRTQQSTQAAKMREAKAKKGEMRGTTNDGQTIGGDSIRNILSDAVNGS